MKIFKPSLLLSATVFLSFLMSCKTTSKDIKPMIDVVIENHSDEVYSFPKGIYYQYIFDNSNKDKFNINKIINILEQSKLQVKNAWYKPASDSCIIDNHNNSDYVMPSLIIQVMKDNKKIEKLGFRKIKSPNVGECASYVRRYYFRRN